MECVVYFIAIDSGFYDNRVPTCVGDLDIGTFVSGISGYEV